ncbi:MAG: TonB-dependent receptor [Gallionella sp.]
MQFRLKLLAAALIFSAGLFMAQGAQAVEVAAGELDAALRGLAGESGIQILFDANELKGARTSGVHGAATPEDALKQLLQGTNYTFTASGAGSYVIKMISPPEKITEMAPIEVRGAPEKAYAVPNASTGTKTDTPLMETPLNVQVVSTQVLDDQKATTLTEALANISGVVSSRKAIMYATPGEQITLRGFAPMGSPGNNAGGNLLTDGVRFEGSGGLVQMANVESVEVLKGPAAILYGRMEPGGVVNVVTKKPLEQTYHSIEQQVGSWGTYRTLVDSTGAVDENKSLLYRVNFAYDKQGSWRDGGVYDKSTFIAPSLLWRVSAQTQLALNLIHNDGSGNADFQVTPFSNSQPTVLPWQLNLNGPSPTTNKTDSIDLTLNHQFNDDWSIKAKAAHGQNKYSGYIMAADLLFLSGSNWMAGQGLTFYDSSAKNDFLNFDLTGHFNTAGIKHTLLLGADMTRNTGDFITGYDDFTMSYTPFDVFGTIPKTLLPPDLVNARRTNYKLDQTGLYLQDQIELSNNVFVTAGLRQQKYATHVVDNQAANTDKTESKVTPRIGILWRAQPWVSLFGSYTESFGAGSGNIYPGTPMPATGAKQYETGVKTETADGKLKGTLAYFDITKTNMATQDLAHAVPLGTWSVPIGEARSNGVELDVQGEIRPNWNAIFTYAHTDARITVDNSDPWQVGDKLADVPPNMASLWTTYAFRQQDFSGWKVGVGLNWRDAAMAKRASNAAPQQSFTPGYSVLNAMASYAFKSGKQKWNAQLNINNLLNKQYWTVSGSPGGGIVYLNYGDPRSVTASLKLEF